MGEVVRVHPRVLNRHQDLSEKSIAEAWGSPLRSAVRHQSAFDDLVVIGVDNEGTLVEMIAVQERDEVWTIYHAMSPPTKRVLRELGLC